MNEQEFLPRGLLIGILLMVAVIIVGTVGFILQGLNPLDALFTTVSAITTVGYLPSHSLSASGKLFTIFLILAGVGTGIYVLSSLTEFLVEGGLRGSWQQRRIAKRMQKLTGHYIITGFGRVGQQVAAQLESAHVQFVVVDHNPTTIAIARTRGLIYFEGDATSDTTLETVGVKRARGLLACADSDVNNVYVTLSARSLNPSIYIVARASNVDAERKLYNAGASRVVSPYTMAGNRMAHLAVRPLAVDYIDVVIGGRNLDVQIEERVVTADSPLVDRTVSDIRSHELAGGHILAVERNKQIITFVGDDLRIAAGDRILVAGTATQLATFDSALER
jgi:voltage-gated potassium channel